MSHSSTKSVLTALFGNFFITILKFIGYFFTKSPSLLAEAIHSLADTANQSLLLIGIKKSNTNYTLNHPYGTGALQFIFNFASAIGIFIFGGLVTIGHAIYEFNKDYHTVNDNIYYIGLIIIIISFIIEGYSCLVALKEIYNKKGKKSIIEYLNTTDDTALLGVFLEDSAAILGLILAFIGMVLSKLYQNNIFDIIAALLIGLMMCFIAIVLILNNTKLLIGKSLNKERQDEIEEFLNSLPLIDKVLEIKTEILGTGKVHLFCNVEINGTQLISPNDIKQDIMDIKNDLEDGDSIAPILCDICDRTVRKLGNKLKLIEKEIKSKFPEIISIDLEIN